jgi:hypothetical protein
MKLYRLAAAANIEGTIIALGGIKNPPNQLDCGYCGMNNTLPVQYNIEDFNELFCRQIYTFHVKRFLRQHIPACDAYFNRGREGIKRLLKE